MTLVIAHAVFQHQDQSVPVDNSTLRMDTNVNNAQKPHLQT